MIKHYQLIGSMSRKGNCWDNAISESFFHTLKVELVHQRLYQTRLQAKQSLFQYIEGYYNRKRRHSWINPTLYPKLELVLLIPRSAVVFSRTEPTLNYQYTRHIAFKINPHTTLSSMETHDASKRKEIKCGN